MRQVSIGLIVFSLFIAAIIFSAGIAVGKALDKETIDEMGSSITSISDRANSFAAILLLDNSSEYCPVLEDGLSRLEGDVESLGYKMSYLEESKNVVDTGLKKRYFDLQLNAYLISGKVRSACSQNFTSILYFYSNKNCFLECREQGKSLLDLKADKRIWAKIYSFDGELGSPSADALRSKFNITSYPSVVVDGKKYEGAQSTEKLAQIILGKE